MFDKEIKFIADFNLNKIKNLGSFFPFEKLMSTDIHPAIIQYISAELDYLIYEDRKKLLRDSMFDYSGSEVAKHFNAVSRIIKMDKRISFEDIKKLVLQAVSFNINFVVRPKWSISMLVYNGAESKAVDEIKLTLEYMYYYEYIKNVILGYLSKRNVISLSQTEFDLILSKIDKELFPSQSQNLVDNAIYSIADFFDQGSVEKNLISPYSLELFLKEKNLMDYLFRLKKALPAEAKQKYDIAELRKVIYTPISAEQNFIKENMVEENTEKEIVEEENINAAEDEEMQDFLSMDIEEQQLEIEKDIKDSEEISNILDDAAVNNTEDDLLSDISEDELLAKYTTAENEEDKTVDAEPNENILEKNIDDMFSFEENESPEQLSEQTKDQKTEEDPSEYIVENEQSVVPADEKAEKTDNESNANFLRARDVFSFISDKEIEKIVNTVFNEDREDFANTMEKIEECSSYEEATEILKSVFLTYRVNPYSKDAVTLTNSISNYFNQS